MLSVAIVEDHPKEAEALRAALDRYCREKGETMQVDLFPEAGDLVENYRAKYAILFLDIELPFMSGMEAAREIRRKDEKVVIIFVTASPRYAMDGYKVGVLDYILKPVTYPALEAAVDAALLTLNRVSDRFLTLPITGGVRKVRIASITYVEVYDHDLIVHTGKEIIHARDTIRSVEQALQGEHFYRIGKSHLVNLYYVEQLQGNTVTVAGESLPLGQSRKKGFLDALNLYMNGDTKR